MLPKGLLKEHFRLLSIILRALDMCAVIGAGILAYYYKFDSFNLSSHYVDALLISAIFTTVVFHFFHIYESVRAKAVRQHIGRLSRAMVCVLILLASLAFLTKTGENYSREWFVSWALLSCGLLILFRCILVIFLRLMRSHGWNERRIIIIGANKLGQRLVRTVHQSIWTGFRIIAIFDDTTQSAPSKMCNDKVLPMPADLAAYLMSQQEGIDEIWFALPLTEEARIKDIMYQLRHNTITSRFILDTVENDLLNHPMTDLMGFPALSLNSTPMVGFNRFIKAIEDRVLASLILLLISPIFLLIAMGIKFSSKGPIFFKQLRHGWDGRIITIYKFRTMFVHKEEGVTQATINDSRITPFGKFLRKTSLDELPQFINVLQGRMSIVGPRPHAVSHNEFYKDSIKEYMQRHKVKPGITGWAQVNGWRGETQTIEKMQKRVEYDLYYIEHWSLAFDLKIILITLFQGFINKNAY